MPCTKFEVTSVLCNVALSNNTGGSPFHLAGGGGKKMIEARRGYFRALPPMNPDR